MSQSTKVISSNFRGHPTKRELLNFWAKSRFDGDRYVLIITPTEDAMPNINILLSTMAKKRVSYDSTKVLKATHYFIPFNNIKTAKSYAAFIYTKGFDSRLTSYGRSIKFDPSTYPVNEDHNEQAN